MTDERMRSNKRHPRRDRCLTNRLETSTSSTQHKQCNAIWGMQAADLIVHQQAANLPLYLPGNLGLSSGLGLHWMLGCQVEGTAQGVTHSTAESSPCRTHPVCCAYAHSSWACILTDCTAAGCIVWHLLQPSQVGNAYTVLVGVSCLGIPACSSLKGKQASFKQWLLLSATFRLSASKKEKVTRTGHVHLAEGLITTLLPFQACHRIEPGNVMYARQALTEHA